MDLLHISDLHVTEPFRSLDEVWAGPRRWAARGCVDFIIVSGDLSQKADKTEYTQLLAFANDHLIPLLRKPERERIIFVPGNHDVDWSRPVGPVVQLSAKSPDEIRRMLRECRHHPSVAQRRLHIGEFGHLELIELDSAKYRQRFGNVQGFLDQYYQGSLSRSGTHHRPFDLLNAHPGHDWSAHVFPDRGDGVAFFGFNSCCANDQFWTGAHIDPTSIQEAARHAEEHAPGLLRVAVWHHGLAGSHGSADYLMLHHLGTLHNHGFRIGFHGHTHRAAADIIPVLEDQIVVIATGSLGAGSAERPDAVGNQFSMVRLYPNRAFVTRYEREGLLGVYRPGTPAVHRLRSTAGEVASPIRAAHHRRTWTVQKDGVAELETVLEDIVADGREVPLAVLDHPLGGLSVGPVVWEGGSLPPEERALGEGRTRYTFNAEKSRYRRIQWRYHVSNAVALNQAELTYREPRRRQFPNVSDGVDGVSHMVRLDADRLELNLVFDPDCQIADVHALVERRVEIRGEQTWERIAEEETRCLAKQDADGTAARLIVEAPTIGWRYSLCYRPSARGKELPPWAPRLTRSLLQKCREVHQFPGALAYSLTQAVAVNLAACLDPSSAPKVWDSCVLGPASAWVGFVWDAGERRLQPAFGQFPPDSWSTNFAAGAGIAGHCFRFSRPVFWHQGAQQRTDVIFHQPRGSRVYAWIVCLPLEIAHGGPAIGVLALAGEERRSDIGERFFQLAVESANGNVQGLGKELASEVNAAFWGTLSRDDAPLTPEDRAEARNVVTTLFPSGDGPPA